MTRAVPRFARELVASDRWSTFQDADLLYGSELFWGGAIAYHLEKLTGKKLIIDFKELFSEMSSEAKPEEKRLTAELEKGIIQRAIILPCVSQKIIDFYAQKYPAYADKFVLLENSSTYEPFAIDYDRKREKVKFILSLGMLIPERGGRQLLQIWERLNPDQAELHIRANHVSTEERKILENTAPLAFKKGTVAFIPPVPEDRMKETLLDYDIGVIPYLADSTLNSRYCCPNKFGQYMNAGLAILSSNTDYITPRIKEYGLGIVYDPNDVEASVKRFGSLIADRGKLNSMRRNAHNFSKHPYNWAISVQPLLQRLSSL